MRALSPKTIYALAASPLLWVAWFYLFVLRQRIHLGFWPLPSHPDPKSAGYMFHLLSIYLGVLIIPIVAIAAIGFVLQRGISDSRFRWWLALGLLALSFASYLAVLYVDPGGYWRWFRD